MMAKSLQIKSVMKTFGQTTALEEIHLDIEKGEFVSLLGPSGCGKSTLLRIIAGLDQPTAGGLNVDGADITASSASSRNIGMVFQSYALFPNMTVRKNIEFALKPKKLSKKTRTDKAMHMLQLVGLEALADRTPQQLSGGQQQRVALARALVIEPDFLLLDEPLSALDANVRHQLQQEIRRIHHEFGMTTIMVTHDQDEALTMADRIAVMNNGRIAQYDTPQNVYRFPADSFVASFIGTSNQIEQLGETRVIRPEHFFAANAQSGMETYVDSMMFKGAYYRLKVSVTDRTSPLFNEKLIVDLPADVVDSRNICPRKIVYLSVHEHEARPSKKVVMA
ncbi:MULTISPECIES: ABC transporter ATP-binding protein [Bacillaceae]|nr:MULTISPECIES: ABC transporter ATP-binding protein [Bacillaceae]